MRLGRHLLVAVLIAVLAACSSSPPVSPQAPAQYRGAGPHLVVVLNHGWHTGVALPSAALAGRLPAVVQRFEGSHYLEFGWGDRDYYQADDKKLTTTIKAALWPTASVLRVLGINHVERYSQRARGFTALCLEDTELAALGDFLAGSFSASAQGQLLALPAGNRYAQFYGAEGAYHLFNTCNTWTAKALASVGMDLFTPAYLTAGGVMDYLQVKYPAPKSPFACPSGESQASRGS